MNRTHALLIALILGIAVAFGTFAATRSVHLGATSRNASKAQLLRREHRLAAAERALRKALASSRTTVAAPATRPRTAPRTVYVRPAPIVIHRHAGGEREAGEREGGGDD